MVKQSILLRRIKETNEVVSTQMLFDDETTEHIIINELPPIEEKVGFMGRYEVAGTGEVSVVYDPIPKTETDLLKEKMDEQDKLIADLMLELAMLQGGLK